MSQCALNRCDRSNSLIQECNSESLVADAKLGNKLALTELWNRNGKVVRNAVWRITGSREDAEDLLQETYLKSYLHINQFDGRAKFSTWLVRIAINSALMLLRKKRGRLEISMASSGEDVSIPVREFRDPSEDVETRYIRLECCKRLRAAVLTLEPSMRHIFELRHEIGLSVKEISQLIGISVPATKSRLLRARVALRESLEPQDSSISRRTGRPVRESNRSGQGVQLTDPQRSATFR